MDSTSRPTGLRHALRGTRRSDAAISSTAGIQRRGGLAGELSLALPPTAMVLVAVFLLQTFAHERILFASLASSAFLIYYDPLHRMNTVRVMVTAQLIACVVGAVAGALSPGYGAAALAMPLTIVLLILLRLVHPPAVSTALGFSFLSPNDRTIITFVAALGVIAMLVVMQRLAAWTLHRVAAEEDSP
jgi:CBS-domain-containing membrane protein